MKKSELRQIIKEEITDASIRAAADHMSDIEQSLGALFKTQVFFEDPKFRILVKKVHNGQWKDVLDYFSRKYQ